MATSDDCAMAYGPEMQLTMFVLFYLCLSFLIYLYVHILNHL